MAGKREELHAGAYALQLFNLLFLACVSNGFRETLTIQGSLCCQRHASNPTWPLSKRIMVTLYIEDNLIAFRSLGYFVIVKSTSRWKRTTN